MGCAIYMLDTSCPLDERKGNLESFITQELPTTFKSKLTIQSIFDNTDFHTLILFLQARDKNNFRELYGFS